MRRARFGTLAFATITAGCASTGAAPSDLAPTPVPVTVASPALPAIAELDGRLRLTVIYPPDSSRIAVRDSNFIFGSTGTGLARLTINGLPVPVAPNGAYLAFLPVPADGVYQLLATKGADTVRLSRRVLLPPDPAADTRITPIVPATAQPRGAIALPIGEHMEVGFVGIAGGAASLILPDGRRITLIETPIDDAGTTDAANFRAGAAPVRRASGASRYAASVRVEMSWESPDSIAVRPGLAPEPDLFAGSSLFGFDFVEDTVLMRRARERGFAVPTEQERARVLRLLQRTESAADSIAAIAMKYHRRGLRYAEFELVANGQTTRIPVDVTLAPLDPQGQRTGVVTAPAGAPADWTARGRAGLSGPFHWFWPAGTRLAIDGERNGMYRVRLTGNLSAWVPAADVALQPEVALPARSSVAGVRMTPRADAIDVRIALDRRLPFRIDETRSSIDVTIYGATSEVNFMQYGSLDPLIANADWSQPAEGEFHVRIDLTQPVWGYDASFDEGNALIVRIRRPPVIDPIQPLRGMLIAVDAGHHQRGSTGPTGLTEAEANLGVARALKPLLEAAGARVLMTRTDAMPVDLGSRPRLATEMNADVLLSLHNNAFPDGVNPFNNNGSSVYYYHPQSIDLAQAVLRELVDELHLPDIGYGRADLAVPRATWMPAILSETMFLMIPQQEAALRDPDVHKRIAMAHLRALEVFLRGRAEKSVSR